jgi:hypothetical protein
MQDNAENSDSRSAAMHKRGTKFSVASTTENFVCSIANAREPK